MLMRTFLLILTLVGCLSHSILAQSESDTLQDSTATLILGYYNSPPFITENENKELEGIAVWLWERISEDLGASFEIKFMPLAEVLDNIEKGTVDLTINPLTVTSERSTRVDFSHPYFVAHSTVAIRQSSTWEKSLLFLYSFVSFDFIQAIFALFLVVLVFGVLVWFFERKKNPEEFQSGFRGIASGIWWSAVTMTTVGYGDKSPRSLGGRVIALIWMFAAIIMISGFTASIASSLTVNQLGWEKNNIEDFKESVVGTVDGSATESWLRKKFFKKIKTFSSVPDGLKALQEGKIEGFVYDEPLLIYLLNQDETYEGLETLPIHFNLQFYSFAFSKKLDNNLQEQISQRIIELTESPSWEIVLSEYDLTLK